MSSRVKGTDMTPNLSVSTRMYTSRIALISISNTTQFMAKCRGGGCLSQVQSQKGNVVAVVHSSLVSFFQPPFEVTAVIAIVANTQKTEANEHLWRSVHP